MKTELLNLKEEITKETKTNIGPCLGKIVKVEETGDIWVDYPENLSSFSVPARLAITADLQTLIKAVEAGQQVVLIFEDNDLEKPIIIGLIQNPVKDGQDHQQTIVESIKFSSVDDIFLDKEKIVLEAKKEILLRCGKGSITLKQNGKIIIKGTNLISRSTGINKIKGAAVQIN